MDYNLQDIVKSKKDISLPRLVERVGTTREYRRLLRNMLKDLSYDLAAPLMYAYEESQEAEEEKSAELLLLAAFLTLRISTEFASVAIIDILTREARYLDRKFIESVKNATKIDVTALTYEKDLDAVLDIIVKRNVSYITDLSDQTRGLIERAVLDAQINGSDSKELKKVLKDILGKQAKRADLIATDQMEKMSAEITAFRVKKAGITKYIWRTQGDHRVRYTHAELNGRLQNTLNPYHGDQGMLPRIPIRCRCWAQWIIEKITE